MLVWRIECLPSSLRRRAAYAPMVDEVGGELERLFNASRWQADGDFVGRPRS